MSRIGKKIIIIPSAVTVARVDDVISVKSPKGELSLRIPMELSLELSDKEIKIMRKAEHKKARSLHGLFRTLIHNMIVGVSEGYEIQQELVGVGYRAEAKGQILELSLGYSHDIHFKLPKEITVQTVTERRSNPVITLKSCDKQLIGHVAAKVRSLRKPEPYKGKGIKYVGEQLRRKTGKAAT